MFLQTTTAGMALLLIPPFPPCFCLVRRCIFPQNTGRNGYSDFKASRQIDSRTGRENARIVGWNLPPVARQACDRNQMDAWQRERISILSSRNMQVDNLGPRVKIPNASHQFGLGNQGYFQRQISPWQSIRIRVFAIYCFYPVPN